MNIMRSRFFELADHLKKNAQNMGVGIDNFDTDVDHITMTDGGHGETEQGWHFCNLNYRGAIFIENISRAQAVHFALLIKAWLDDNDEIRRNFKLALPDFKIIELDGGQIVDVSFNVDFVDPVFLTLATDDNMTNIIEWNGRRFATTEHPVLYATEGEVNGAPVSI